MIQGYHQYKFIQEPSRNPSSSSQTGNLLLLSLCSSILIFSGSQYLVGVGFALTHIVLAFPSLMTGQGSDEKPEWPGIGESKICLAGELVMVVTVFVSFFAIQI